MDILVGTEIKVNVHIDVNGYNMDDFDFHCDFYTGTSKTVTVGKEAMTRVDEHNYIATFSTEGMVSGTIMMKVEAEIPDGDFEDGFRTEKGRVSTGIRITR